jgi:hypothetical protein
VRNTIIALALATGLTACNGTVTADSIVAEIAKNCGIAVVIADIAAIMVKQSGGATVSGIAKSVCDAFTSTGGKAKASRTGEGGALAGVVQVDGVDVHYVTK